MSWQKLAPGHVSHESFLSHVLHVNRLRYLSWVRGGKGCLLSHLSAITFKRISNIMEDKACRLCLNNNWINQGWSVMRCVCHDIQGKHLVSCFMCITAFITNNKLNLYEVSYQSVTLGGVSPALVRAKDRQWHNIAHISYTVSPN